jgi:hypothetical protein
MDSKLMGNHDVGRAMASAAEVFWIASDGFESPTQEKALAALDKAAERFRGADAEFDDEFHGKTPLSEWVALAFGATPEQIASRDTNVDDGEAWYEGVYRKFRDRYEFC